MIKACQNDFALVGTSANALVDLSDVDGCKNAQGKAVGIANLAAFAFLPEACDPDTYLLAGLGSYCATAKQSPSTYTVPVGDTRYLLAHNSGLHGIWLYDTDDPTFKITVLPNLKAESNLGIKADGQGFYGLSGAVPQSALTPFIQQIKASGSTFVYDDTTTANMVLLRKEAQLQGVNSVKVWECNSGCYDPSFYQQGGATVNGTYAMLLELPYLSDYKVNPTLDKLITELGGVNNFNNNALDSFIEALMFQDAVQKAVANGGTLDRETLFTALKNEHSFTADGIVGSTDIGNRARTHLPGARAAAERCLEAGGPGQAGDLQLRQRQQHDDQDDRRPVAGPARNKRRARSRRMASRGRRKSVGVVEMASDLGISTTTVSRAERQPLGPPGARRQDPGTRAGVWVRRQLHMTGRRSADRNDMTTGRSRALIGTCRRARNSK